MFKTTIMINLQNYASVREAARQIGIHEESLRRLLRMGSPPGVKIGGQWFIDREQLALFSATYDTRTGKRNQLL
ncbi:DNA-binding protein [Chloroflexota bacterium]